MSGQVSIHLISVPPRKTGPLHIQMLALNCTVTKAENFPLAMLFLQSLDTAQVASALLSFLNRLCPKSCA